MLAERSGSGPAELRRDHDRVIREPLRDGMRSLEPRKLDRRMHRDDEVMASTIDDVDATAKLAQLSDQDGEDERMVDWLADLMEGTADELPVDARNPDEAEVVGRRDDDPPADLRNTDELQETPVGVGYVFQSLQADRDVERLRRVGHGLDVCHHDVAEGEARQAPAGDLDGPGREIGRDEMGTSLLQVTGEATAPAADLDHLEPIDVPEVLTRELVPRSLTVVLRNVPLGVPAVVALTEGAGALHGGCSRRRHVEAQGSRRENSLEIKDASRDHRLAAVARQAYSHGP